MTFNNIYKIKRVNFIDFLSAISLGLKCLATPIFILLLWHISSTHCMESVLIRSFFRSVFFSIWTEYGEILRSSPYSVRMRKIRTRKNSVLGHISHSDNLTFFANSLEQMGQILLLFLFSLHNFKSFKILFVPKFCATTICWATMKFCLFIKG